MKTMTPLLKTLTLLASAFALTLSVRASDKAWSGGAGDRLWNSAGNWAPSKPTSADDVIFGNVDSTGTAGSGGLANNVVDVGFANAIRSLRYTNMSGFHNTRLTNNLVISASSSSIIPLCVGTGEAGTANQAITATIQGNATLAITNTSGIIRVCEGNPIASGSGKATLNMVGLDNFAASVSGIYQALNADGNTSSTNNRPCADILLAKTNYIAATTITISESFNNGGAQSAFRLGQVNTFNLGTLRVGSRKGNGLFNFNTGLSSPTAKFRGQSGGTTRGIWTIGDDFGSASGTGSTGLMDLTGGTVDALVETIYVGKGQTVTGAAGDGVGTLTFNLGTIDVNALEIGYQTIGGPSVGRGTVNVNGTGLMKVNNDIRMGYVQAGNTDTTTGALNITGGTVTVGGNIVDGGADASTTTLTVTGNGTLNMKPSGDTTAGNITVDILNVGVASITNYDTITTTNITVKAPATAFTVYTSEALAPVGVGVAGLLTVNGSLTLTNATLKLDLGTTSDQIAVTNALELDGANTVLINPVSGFGAGTYAVMTYGPSLIGDPTNNIMVGGGIANSRYSFFFDTNTANTLTLNIGGAGPSTLTWSGDGGGNVWNLNGIANWNAGGGPDTEKFYSLDAVTFDDTGSASPAVNLVGPLIPGSVTVTGTKAYTFAGSGKLSGPNGLSDSSSGTLTILTTNDYSGATSIGVGATLQLGDGATANGGSLGSSELQNYGALLLNPVSYQTVAGVISGSGTLTKTGPGVTVLSGANNFTSPLTISNGTLRAGTAAALGDATVATTITNTGTLDVAGFNFGDEPIIVSGAGVGGAGAIVNSGATQGNAFDNVALAGDTVFGGPNRWDIDGINASSTKLGLQGNGYNLTKVAANQVSVACYNPGFPWNTALGTIDSQAGILSIQAYVSLGANTKSLIIRSNAAVEFCHNGPTVLDKPISMTNSCIQARFFSSSYPAYSDLSGPITLTGSNVFDVFATTMSLVVDGAIGGSGSLNKGIGGHAEGGNTSTGVGTLILVASNSFTGDLRVQTGALVLSNTASVTKAANIVMAGGTLDATKRTDLTLTLAATQTLKGNGTLAGTVTSPANTTISPGISTTAATLAVTGSVNLGGNTVMDITKTNTTKASDKLTATGAIDLGGTLTVNFSGNTALAPGDRFTLFTAGSYTHSFAATNLPALSGMAWSNSITSGNWNVEVIATEPTTPPFLTNQLVSGSVKLSWDTSYTSYVLLGQTNAVGAGLNTNSSAWAPVPGVVGNQVTIPIDTSVGSVFFKLKK